MAVTQAHSITDPEWISDKSKIIGMFKEFTFLYRQKLNILHQLVASDKDSKWWPTYGKI